MNLDAIESIINDDKNNNQQNLQAKNYQNEYLNDFLIESKEHLESIERCVLVLENNTNDKSIVDNIFRDFHTIKGLAGFVSQSVIQKIAHQTESLLDKCRKGEIVLTSSHIELILKSADYIKNICEDLDLGNDKNYILKINDFLKTFSLEDEIEKKQDKAKKTTVNKSLKPINEDSFVRIPVSKIDSLVEMVGELVINHLQFEEQSLPVIKNDDKLNENMHRISSLTKDIQNLSLSLRMVSLKSLFLRIERIGRDTIVSLNKNAEIVVSGEDTEIDRNIVEKLVDPLIHLIKNSIYHGIESENERKEQGKSPVGTVKLSAYSKRGNVYIEVSDDGRGIAIDNVLNKAVEKNLVPHLDYSESEIQNFIFLPGFSTVDKADEIAGRGVGLDVVKTHITKIGGSVEVQNSKSSGCTFKLKLPISLAVQNGTIVEIKGTRYIILTTSIIKAFKPETQDWISVKGVSKMVRFEDQIIEIINIDKILDIKDFDKQECIMLVLKHNGKLKALPVNFIVEKRDIIVKSLGSELDNLPYVFGASILKSGKIGIILDVENLFNVESD